MTKKYGMKTFNTCELCGISYSYHLKKDTSEIETKLCWKCRKNNIIKYDDDTNEISYIPIKLKYKQNKKAWEIKENKKDESFTSGVCKSGICKRCGNIFNKNQPFQMYCCYECSKPLKIKYETIKYKCIKCGGIFEFDQKNYYKNRSPILCKKCKNKIHPEIYYMKLWAKCIIGGHQRRGHTVNIKIEELVKMAYETKYCILCGNELKYSGKINDTSNYNAKLTPMDKTASMDRILNNNIYNISEVGIICKRCNSLKGDISFEQLKRTIKGYVKYIQKIEPTFLNK